MPYSTAGRRVVHARVQRINERTTADVGRRNLREGNALLIRTAGPAFGQIGEALREESHRVVTVCGVRAFAAPSPTMTVSNPPDRPALVDASHAPHVVCPFCAHAGLARGGCTAVGGTLTRDSRAAASEAKLWEQGAGPPSRYKD